jgi:hypothetical protein
MSACPKGTVQYNTVRRLLRVITWSQQKETVRKRRVLRTYKIILVNLGTKGNVSFPQKVTARVQLKLILEVGLRGHLLASGNGSDSSQKRFLMSFCDDSVFIFLPSISSNSLEYVCIQIVAMLYRSGPADSKKIYKVLRYSYFFIVCLHNAVDTWRVLYPADTPEYKHSASPFSSSEARSRLSRIKNNT